MRGFESANIAKIRLNCSKRFLNKFKYGTIGAYLKLFSRPIAIFVLPDNNTF